MNSFPVQIRSDVVVVGGGNAALTAAIAAAERGRTVTLVERGFGKTRGGNSRFTAGATRITHDGLTDLLSIVDADTRHSRTVVPPYTAAEYREDLARVTGGRNDPDLTDVLVRESAGVLRWLHDRGARYRLMYERQAYERPDGTHLFWGGLHVGNTGGGVGLVDDLTRIAVGLGVDIRYRIDVDEIIADDGRITGVRGVAPEGRVELAADSVVLAAGGFEADARMRRQYLGEGWQDAKVRGTPFNDGSMLRAALALGAARGGDWTTAHATQWDAHAADNESNYELTNRLTRQSYPLGILVNAEGVRFVDEGSDFRNYTYAKLGAAVLGQPGHVAWQIFDVELSKLLRAEEYQMPGISVEIADTIADLAAGIGVPVGAMERTVAEFNRSIDSSRGFDPSVKDGRAAAVHPPKSNWAHAIATPPFAAYAVTCGITFTFGGLKSDTEGRVLDTSGVPIPGLLVCGEMLGGLFSENYPGGSGLAAGAVFGRRAGRIA